jgi:PAS domain S-box-containing protein
VYPGNKLRALVLRGLSVPQRFAVLTFLCVVAITVLVCGLTGIALRRELVKHDGAVTGDLASLLFASIVPAEFFAAPPGTEPPGAERLKEFAQSREVVRFIVYDTGRRVLWSSDASLIGRRFGEHREVKAALRGETVSTIIRPGAEPHHSELKGFARLEEVYAPVRYRSNGPIVGAIELYRAPPGLFAALDHGVLIVWLVGGVAGVLLYLTLFAVARRYSRTQVRLEAERAEYARLLEARVAERTRELTRLYAATREREHETRVLYETTGRFGELTDNDALLRAIVEGAVTLTRASYGGVGFPEGDEMVNHWLVDPSQRGPTVARLKIAESLAGLAFVSGAPQIANTPLEDPRVNRALARAHGIRNIAFVPLQYRGRVMGVLFVGNKEVGPFAEQDIGRLRAFGHHAAVALEREQLRAETLKREREASILYRTGTRLHAQTALDALLATIVEGAIEIAQATSGGITERVGDEDIMRALVGVPLLPGETEIRMPVAESVTALVYDRNEPVIVNRIGDAPNSARLKARCEARGIYNFACVPLKVKNATLGVIKVFNKRGGAPFSDDDVRLLATFATHAAMALDNARLLHEMKGTKEYLENLIAASVDAIVTVDPRGRITFVSQGGQCMFGCSAAEMVGRSIRALWAPGARDFRAFRKRLLRDKRIGNHETELAVPGGRRLAVNISASFLRGATGDVTGVLAVIKDVTALRQLHEQMVRSERLAAAGLLAAGIAHEVGNPLACVSSLAQVLIARTTDDGLRRGLEDIEIHVDRIGRIVQDLTRLTRPTPVTLREAKVQDLVETAVSLARHNPVVRRMKVQSTVDADLPAVRVAPDHLVQVFLNLILNAADAGGDLAIRAVRANDTIRVIFQDSGCGMTPEQMCRLFDPFHSTKDSETHLGLGLFVSHEIVRQHGGELLVDSRRGAGATLTVVLPVERLPVPLEALA